MSGDRIPMLDVVAQNAPIEQALKEAAARVIASGRFILGPEVQAFEQEVAAYIGVKHAIGVSSGTDALLVALMGLGIGPGDEVITTPFSFFATAGCIARVGAKPVFVDIEPQTFNLDPDAVQAAITDRTKALLPVHLFGQACDMPALIELAARNNLPIIEDAAQAIGTQSPAGPVGGLGAYGCFSFFPSKNLGGFGDGGLVTTNDDDLADRARTIRVHGSKPKYFHHVVGGNFRLDALQAALLRVKLGHLAQWTEGRRNNAARYNDHFARAGLPTGSLIAPPERVQGHVYNQYVIRTDRRDALKAHLADNNIDSAIYYPLGLHQQACFADLGYKAGSMAVTEAACDQVLALPIFSGLGPSRLDVIATSVIDFLR